MLVETPAGQACQRARRAKGEHFSDNLAELQRAMRPAGQLDWGDLGDDWGNFGEDWGDLGAKQ